MILSAPTAAPVLPALLPTLASFITHDLQSEGYFWVTHRLEALAALFRHLPPSPSAGWTPFSFNSKVPLPQGPF